MLKQGAMFGLDARIALAIFGALSVISGAALYSAIQQANVVGLVTEMKEIEKALEQYILDSGVDIGNDRATAAAYIGCLVDSGDCTNSNIWNGPYLSYEKLSYSNLDHPKYTSIYLRNVLDSDWEHPSDDSGSHYCAADTSKACYYWILINGTSIDFQKAIDEYVDNSDGALKGNIRFSGTELYLKSIPLINQ